MKTPISRNNQIKNLHKIIPLLHDLEYFIMLGTLLGYARDNAIIENDDDIDFYVNKKDKPLFLERLENNTYFDFNENVFPNHTPHFIQLTKDYEDEHTRVDLTFYELNDKFLIDVFSFNSNEEFQRLREKNLTDERLDLHIPKELIFPLDKKNFENIKVKVPSRVLQTVEFLYGSRWREPLIKGVDYNEKIVNNSPLIRYVE